MGTKKILNHMLVRPAIQKLLIADSAYLVNEGIVEWFVNLYTGSELEINAL